MPFTGTALNYDVLSEAVLNVRACRPLSADWKKRIVTDPKTPDSKRKVLMPDFLCEEMKQYMAMQYEMGPKDRLFPVSKSYLYRVMNKGCELSGVPRIRIHDLRHSHVSLLIDMGFSAVSIAKRMGHKSIDITYRYAHMFPNVQAQMADQLNLAWMERKESVA